MLDFGLGKLSWIYILGGCVYVTLSTAVLLSLGGRFVIALSGSFLSLSLLLGV